MFSPAAKNPKRQQTCGSTDSVNAHVRNQRGPGKNKTLMEFVGRRVKHDHQHYKPDFTPVPRPWIILRWFVHSTPEQHREHGVFNRVCAFAEQKMNRIDLCFRHAREEPV